MRDWEKRARNFLCSFKVGVRGLKTLKIIMQAGFIFKRLDSTSRSKEKRQPSPCKLLQHDSTN